jgi:hypothetical protein
MGEKFIKDWTLRREAKTGQKTHVLALGYSITFTCTLSPLPK